MFLFVVAFVLTWYQVPATPGVNTYNLYVNATPGATVTPEATWAATEATPAGANVWRRDYPLGPGDTANLQSCNGPTPGTNCSDWSNPKVVPSSTPTHTPTATVTPTNTRPPNTPKAPVLWDIK